LIGESFATISAAVGEAMSTSGRCQEQDRNAFAARVGN